MDSPHIANTQVSSNTPNCLSVALLLERGIACFQREHYAEGMALLTLADELLTPEWMHLTGLLTMLRCEYAKHFHLQQTLQEVSARFIEVQTELEANIAAFSALSSRLLTETLSKQIQPVPREVDSLQVQESVEDDSANPTLYAVCFGPFELRYQGVPLALCSNRNGQAILRYLVAQPDHRATADTLMALLWPDDTTEVALRKLYVTVSILRRSLQKGCDLPDKYILHKQGVYQLNPVVLLHSDVEEFLALYNTGRKLSGEAAVYYYEKACSLYTRPFLIEDLYADWSFTRREQLRQIRLSMCSALASHYLEVGSYEIAARWAAAGIEENRCDEAAYRQLMHIYALAGRRNEALRQYQLCQQALLDELHLQPMPETVALYEAIIQGKFNR
ncbi:MAG: winged helix-turn-helix domain-containing protein [Chloroflexi bacterium]|nr:winged helix-turn-helix domain-containing protein [Ktedonobacteraceae bacterium]MBV9707736.1 winged helix-turn-helix domain-containing protein [Chloroflexota bacterium]